jgi:hypothetical protein
MGETEHRADGPEDGAGEVPRQGRLHRGEPDPEGQGLTPVDGVVLADGTVPVLDGIAVLGDRTAHAGGYRGLPAAARRL